MKRFSRDLQANSSFDAGHDKAVTTPRMFIDDALRQKPAGMVSDRDALLIKEDFLANYGDPDKRVNVLDFWSSDDGKDTIANAFGDLGFDSIKIKEEGVDTLGMLRMKPDNGPMMSVSKAQAIEELESAVCQLQVFTRFTTLQQAGLIKPKNLAGYLYQSLAVAGKDTGFDSFGEISLIGDKRFVC